VSGDHVERFAVATFVAVVALYCFGYVAARLYARGNVSRLLGNLLMLASALVAITLGWLTFQGLAWVMAE
jgi:hypothetical protein